MNKFQLIGSAFGHGAQIYGTSKSPFILQDMLKEIGTLNANFNWTTIIDNRQVSETHTSKGKNYEAVLEHNIQLAQTVEDSVRANDELLVVIGGDHSCGIGTWSGVVSALDCAEKFGLIWIDAHMDAHTYSTSPSKAYHGMPVSNLIGQGDDQLSNISFRGSKISPENLVLIGIRSYEPQEKELLEKNNVKIFYMEDITPENVHAVFEEALKIATNGTKGFGISLDLDVFDPIEVPGVGSPEANGLSVKDGFSALPVLFKSPKLKALEITEFNPDLDQNQKSGIVLHKILENLESSRNESLHFK